MSPLDSGCEPPLPFSSCADLDGINIIFPPDSAARQENGLDFLKRMAATLNPHPVHYWVVMGENIVQQTLRITVQKQIIARNLPAPPAIREMLDQAAIDALFDTDTDSELDHQLFLYVSSLQRLVELTEQARQLSYSSQRRQETDISFVVGTRKPLREKDSGDEPLGLDADILWEQISTARELVNVTRRVLEDLVYKNFRARVAKMEAGVPVHLLHTFREFTEQFLKVGKAMAFCVPPVLSVTASGEPHITIYPWLLRILQRTGAVHMQIDMTPLKDNLVAASDKPFFLRMAFGFEQFSRFHLMELQRQGLLPLAREQLGRG